jgi:hypothetical protein
MAMLVITHGYPRRFSLPQAHWKLLLDRFCQQATHESMV